MNFKALLTAFVAGLLLASYITKTYFPTKQVEEKIVNVVKKDVRTVTRIVVKKDGTTETVMETNDQSVEKASKSTTKVDKIETLKLGLKASAQSYGETPTYGLQAEKRILGPFWAGIEVDTRKQVGVILSYSF